MPTPDRPQPADSPRGRESWEHPCIVLDVDGTICPTRSGTQSYAELDPFPSIVAKMRDYRDLGYYIILHTGRQMRTYNGNVGLITVHTVPVLVQWLRDHGIPFDELHAGRPWPGFDGFYVCDSTVSPKMFLEQSPQEIRHWLDSQQL